MKNPYEVLGVPRDADVATIKAAYRKLAQETHPDKQGGDTSLFVDVKLAYDVLSDPEKRREYDTTGDVGQGIDPMAKAVETLSLILQAILPVLTPESDNLIDAVKKCLNDGAQRIAAQTKEIKARIAKRNQMIERTTRKDIGENVIVSALQSQNKIDSGSLANLAAEQENAQLMRKLLADYSYKTEPKPERPPFRVVKNGQPFSFRIG